MGRNTFRTLATISSLILGCEEQAQYLTDALVNDRFGLCDPQTPQTGSSSV